MDLYYLQREHKPTLAYIHTPAGEEGKALPAVMFLGGYRSDMNGTKAQYLEQHCAARGQEFLRFDYSGHGASDGRFSDGTIGSWAGDALDILDHVIKGPVILVGSSMGGWMALLVAKARTEKIHALIGIAAAPDFTKDLFARLDNAQKQTLQRAGEVFVENDYSDEPYHYTLDFYEESKAHFLLNTQHNVAFPIHLIQGGEDKDVLPKTPLTIEKSYQSPNFNITMIADGDHRLSREEDLVIIDREIQTLSQM